MNKTATEKEAAYDRLSKASNEELRAIGKHVLGYDIFTLPVNRYALPSNVRAQLLAILKEKIINDKLTFTRDE